MTCLIQDESHILALKLILLHLKYGSNTQTVVAEDTADSRTLY